MNDDVWRLMTATPGLAAWAGAFLGAAGLPAWARWALALGLGAVSAGGMGVASLYAMLVVLLLTGFLHYAWYIPPLFVFPQVPVINVLEHPLTMGMGVTWQLAGLELVAFSVTAFALARMVRMVVRALAPAPALPNV